MSESAGIRILSDNRRARRLYFLSEYTEAGLMLTGTEVKSARAGKVQLVDAYAAIRGGELWLLNLHISPYAHGNQQNHDPLRPRKLLLHRKEIDRFFGKIKAKGLTLIPTKIYLKRGKVKCEIALAKGKKLFDKRETERRRDAEQEARAALRQRG